MATWKSVSDLIVKLGDFKLRRDQEARLIELDAEVNERSSPETISSALAELTEIQLEIMIAERSRSEQSRANKERIKEDIRRAFLSLNSEANAFVEKLFRMFQYFSIIPSRCRMSYRAYTTLVKALSSAVLHIENPECARKSEVEREDANDRDPTIDDIMCYLSDSIIPAPNDAQTIVNQEMIGRSVDGRTTDSGARAVGASSAYGSVYLLLLKKRNVAVKVPKVKGIETLMEASVGFLIMNTLFRNDFWRRNGDLARVLPFYGVFSCNAPIPIETAGRATLPICSAAGGGDPVLYTVTKRVDDPTLESLLHSRRITLDQVREVVRQVWSFLIVLQGTSLEFVHNDLHPGNIFVDLSGPAPVATIIDYGLSSFNIGGQRMYGSGDQRYIEFGITLGADPLLRESPGTLVTGLVDLIQLIYFINAVSQDDEIKLDYLDQLWNIYGYINEKISPNWTNFESFREFHHLLGRDSPLLWAGEDRERLRLMFMDNLMFLNENTYSEIAIGFLGFDGEEIARLHAISDEINEWFVSRPPRDFLSATTMEALARTIE